MDIHKQAFREEAYELIAELETSLLELEESPDDEDAISRVFRAMHTIKGSGAMFGFEDIAAFTHDVETVFDLVRNGRMKVTKELINLTLAARDLIKAMLDASCSDAPVDMELAGEILAGLRTLVPPGEMPPAGAVEGAEKGASPVPDGEGPKSIFRIRFSPDKRVFATGTNPLNLLKELEEMGDCRIVAHNCAIPPLEDLDPESCYSFWNIILRTAASANDIRDVFIFVEDDCELKVDLLETEEDPAEELDYKKLGEILLERGDIAPQELRKALEAQKRIGEMLVNTGVLTPDTVQSALAEQQFVKEVRKERQAGENVSSIRVPAEKLDLMVNLVGEMVTVQAHLSQLAACSGNTELVTVAEEVERLVADLRDNTLNIRMLPIGTTFTKFQRLVRDLSAELGKEIDMITAGAETELDKTVIEKLGDPLVHIIRNSIDHGIECPDTRKAAGKPSRGTIRLSARHSGDSVLITIRDDGKGLDKEAIRAKAVEKGLIQANAELSEKEIFNLVFAPGFSTAKQVTSLSGRGVGMDVVKQSIDSLRGSIELSSTLGEGTVITLRIPLTLAIIESLLVRIGDDSYLMPLSVVEECVELSRADVARGHGRNIANVRGAIVPYIPLREHFYIAGEPPEIQQIVITDLGDTRIGFVVDRVVGEHQTVIKSLGHAYRDVKGVSGATILGDGAVALILDLPQIYLSSVEMEQMAA